LNIKDQVRLQEEKRELEEVVREWSSPESTCPCGFLMATVCNYATNPTEVWVEAEEAKTRDLIRIYKYSMARNHSFMPEISVISNCPRCDTAVGFIGQQPIVIQGMHHATSVIDPIHGWGSLEKILTPMILDAEEEDDFDPCRDFEWPI